MLSSQPEIGTVIAISGMVVGLVGAGCALVGGGIAFYNSRKAVHWKRAELANSYLRDFNNNPELVFACRCLDWNGGRLPLPESLRAINDDAKFIEHDRAVFREALRPDLRTDEFEHDPRIQIYRMAIDSFLSWLALVAGALERNLFVAEDIEEVGYWVAKLESEQVMRPFIVAYGYQASVEKLVRCFREGKGAYQRWVFPPNPAGTATRERQS
ncbi:hypothetical protein [Aureimonas pseudogalii]|uniref:DUF4760 domain-containing protein n=1 Tax=Aureimonas pseudogalii TaxID=1744844 RepID=A0A7W6EBM7_9HYPH|nr:hypothetical protein [Aureimonas pseudogalii]MBB3998378.1 hypothetical protein [Aureimonas pseudogalii]